MNEHTEENGGIDFEDDDKKSQDNTNPDKKRKKTIVSVDNLSKFKTAKLEKPKTVSIDSVMVGVKQIRRQLLVQRKQGRSWSQISDILRNEFGIDYSAKQLSYCMSKLERKPSETVAPVQAVQQTPQGRPQANGSVLVPARRMVAEVTPSKAVAVAPVPVSVGSKTTPMTPLERFQDKQRASSVQVGATDDDFVPFDLSKL